MNTVKSKKTSNFMKLESSFLMMPVVRVGHVSLVKRSMDATRMVIFTFSHLLKLSNHLEVGCS